MHKKYSNETKIRVRYGETDKMGYVYYGNYPLYYEVGRTELMRSLGFPYEDLEKMGLALPVRSLNINYYKPAFYDDILTVKTSLEEIPSAKIVFHYEVYNQDDVLLNEGDTTLVFINQRTQKISKAPVDMVAELKKRLE